MTLEAYRFDNFSMLYLCLPEDKQQACKTCTGNCVRDTMCVQIQPHDSVTPLGFVCAICAPTILCAASRVGNPTFCFFFKFVISKPTTTNKTKNKTKIKEMTSHFIFLNLIITKQVYGIMRDKCYF